MFRGPVLKYLLILFIIMIALSPLLSMMPTRRQRKIADLRQRAAVCGLAVQLRDAPEALRMDTACAFYQRRRERDEPRLERPVLCLYIDDQWRQEQGSVNPARRALLDALPKGVLAVVGEPTGVGAFWLESGEVDDVDTIKRVLGEWVGQS